MVWLVSWPWVSGFGGVSYHLDPHLGLKSSGAVDRGFWGQKIFNLGFEEIEGEEAQVQGLLVLTFCFRYEGQGSLSPEAAGYHQEHSECSCTYPGQLSWRR